MENVVKISNNRVLNNRNARDLNPQKLKIHLFGGKNFQKNKELLRGNFIKLNDRPGTIIR